MSSEQSVTLPAPQIDVSPVPTSKWRREYDAFQYLRPQLLQTHQGQYVVIHNGQVVDSGTDEVALALRFFAQYGNVSPHIGLVSTEPEPIVRIPHYRELRKPGEAS
jgi:hypothetical protein